jgi:biopolymer transport protein ExbB/TolQ
MGSKTKGIFSQSFIVQNVGLVFAIVAVGLLYSLLIRPQARVDEALSQRIQATETGGETYAPQRSIFIILKDYEQQVCLTLMVWAGIILFFKLFLVAREQQLLKVDFVPIEEGERIIPDDALDYYKDLNMAMDRKKTWKERLVPQVVLIGLHRFNSTRSIQDVVNAIRDRSELAAEEMESDLSLVRYIAWAIPSVGFIGTVRGIGDALAQADKAIEGDISGVTSALGLAFNSTLIALLLSIVLMFMLHLLQSRQEGFILDVDTYCREKLVGLMKIPIRDESRLQLPQ